MVPNPIGGTTATIYKECTNKAANPVELILYHIIFLLRQNRSTVNMVIFAGGKFRKNVGKTFHVGVFFTKLLLFPSYKRYIGFIFTWG